METCVICLESLRISPFQVKAEKARENAKQRAKFAKATTGTIYGCRQRRPYPGKFTMDKLNNGHLVDLNRNKKGFRGTKNMNNPFVKGVAQGLVSEVVVLQHCGHLSHLTCLEIRHRAFRPIDRAQRISDPVECPACGKAISLTQVRVIDFAAHEGFTDKFGKDLKYLGMMNRELEEQLQNTISKNESTEKALNDFLPIVNGLQERLETYQLKEYKHTLLENTKRGIAEAEATLDVLNEHNITLVRTLLSIVKDYPAKVITAKEILPTELIPAIMTIKNEQNMLSKLVDIIVPKSNGLSPDKLTLIAEILAFVGKTSLDDRLEQFHEELKRQISTRISPSRQPLRIPLLMSAVPEEEGEENAAKEIKFDKPDYNIDKILRATKNSSDRDKKEQSTNRIKSEKEIIREKRVVAKKSYLVKKISSCCQTDVSVSFGSTEIRAAQFSDESLNSRIENTAATPVNNEKSNKLPDSKDEAKMELLFAKKLANKVGNSYNVINSAKTEESSACSSANAYYSIKQSDKYSLPPTSTLSSEFSCSENEDENNYCPSDTENQSIKNAMRTISTQTMEVDPTIAPLTENSNQDPCHYDKDLYNTFMETPVACGKLHVKKGSCAFWIPSQLSSGEFMVDNDSTLDESSTIDTECRAIVDNNVDSSLQDKDKNAIEDFSSKLLAECSKSLEYRSQLPTDFVETANVSQEEKSSNANNMQTNASATLISQNELAPKNTVTYLKIPTGHSQPNINQTSQLLGNICQETCKDPSIPQFSSNSKDSQKKENSGNLNSNHNIELVPKDSNSFNVIENGMVNKIPPFLFGTPSFMFTKDDTNANSNDSIRTYFERDSNNNSSIDVTPVCSDDFNQDKLISLNSVYTTYPLQVINQQSMLMSSQEDIEPPKTAINTYTLKCGKELQNILEKDPGKFVNNTEKHAESQKLLENGNNTKEAVSSVRNNEISSTGIDEIVRMRPETSGFVPHQSRYKSTTENSETRQYECNIFTNIGQNDGRKSVTCPPSVIPIIINVPSNTQQQSNVEMIKSPSPVEKPVMKDETRKRSSKSSQFIPLFLINSSHSRGSTISSESTLDDDDDRKLVAKFISKHFKKNNGKLEEKQRKKTDIQDKRSVKTESTESTPKQNIHFIPFSQPAQQQLPTPIPFQILPPPPPQPQTNVNNNNYPQPGQFFQLHPPPQYFVHHNNNFERKPNTPVVQQQNFYQENQEVPHSPRPTTIIRIIPEPNYVYDPYSMSFHQEQPQQSFQINPQPQYFPLTPVSNNLHLENCNYVIPHQKYFQKEQLLVPNRNTNEVLGQVTKRQANTFFPGALETVVDVENICKWLSPPPSPSSRFEDNLQSNESSERYYHHQDPMDRRRITNTPQKRITRSHTAKGKR